MQVKEIPAIVSIMIRTYSELLDYHMYLRLRQRQRHHPAAKRVCTEGDRAENKTTSQQAPKCLPCTCPEGPLGFKEFETDSFPA